MTSAVKSLWPAQIKPDILSPKQILRAQANALTELTKGVLVGSLSESLRNANELVLTLDMYAPAIKYSHRVLTATHSPTLLYPVLLDADVFRPNTLSEFGALRADSHMMGKKPESQADNDEELVRLVEQVLTSPAVVSRAQSLIALSNETEIPTNYIHHLKNLNEAEQESAIDEKISDTYYEILDSEVFASAVAGTNATGWGVDGCEIGDFDIDDEECIVHLSYSASGDQEEDKMYAGDKVTGTAEAVIDSHGAVEYREITAEVAHDYDDSDSGGESKPLE